MDVFGGVWIRVGRVGEWVGRREWLGFLAFLMVR